jgi:glycosyltransferase involved in cell wall biosynthesis
MKIGVVFPEIDHEESSLVHVCGSTLEVLQQEHELIYRPPGHTFHSKEWQKDMLKEMMLSCDVLLGLVEPLALEVRQGIDKQIPYCCFVLGSMPRGGGPMKWLHHLFRTTDVILVNCTSDLEIVNNLLENARVRLLPFAIRESDFRPLDEAAKQAIRATLGFDAEDKILLYPGRITVEKNVHSILRIFSTVQRFVPNSRLMIVGRTHNISFLPSGTYPLNLKRTLERAVTTLGIDQDRVRFIDYKERGDLCSLYNIADVVINMTLHHDENFGLSQVEAMACGTPVVGTSWGGLKDTIAEGETGYQVSTIVTGSGVKLNWWEAVNKIVWLFRNESEHLQLRKKCVEIAHKRYSLSQYRDNLRSILAECQGEKRGVCEPLKVSEFARQYWANPRQLYKELIAPYTGRSRDGEAIGGGLKADQVICLANPLIEVDDGLFEINDPMYPLSITIPARHKRVICAAIEAIRREPAITVERLTTSYLDGQAEIQDALEWMIETGLILRCGFENGAISARSISSQMSLPLFSFQSVDPSSDIAFLR